MSFQEYRARRYPTFSTMEEMEAFTYGRPGMIQKADAPVITTTTGVWQALLGKTAWIQVNHESNAFKILKKTPWGRSGDRVLTTRARSSPNGIAEDASLPESVKSTYATFTHKPKTQFDVFEVGQVQGMLAAYDDALDAWQSEREEFSRLHAEMINVALTTDVTTLASNNFESLDRVVSSYAEVTNCGDVNAGDSDIYGIDRDAATGWSDATVNHNSNTNRSLTLSLINTLPRDVFANGGTPKVYLTKQDTYMAWNELLQSNQSYFGEKPYIATYGGVETVAPGYEGGFAVSTYLGVPVILSKDVVDDSLGRIYCLDTDYIEFRVLQPTKYYETGIDMGKDPWANGKVSNKGGYETIGELVATRFNTSAKLRDLTT